MTGRLIIADENIPYASAWFGALGQVDTRSGRALKREDVRTAEVLLVRSVTRVDRALLEGSQIRFVGTATIGTDHLDLDYLRANGIAYASAPGSNAPSVVEYVLSGLCALDGVLERLLAGGSVGIVGLGNVGSRLLERLRRLGIRCIGYDPLLPVSSALPLRPLDEVLAADVVCCHTPLTRDGAFPTYHLLDRERLLRLKPGAVLLNAGRGAVIDNTALNEVLRERPDIRAVLDVWENEPAIDRALLQQVAIATPHIAGYSWDGKLAGTRMILEACCNFLKVAVPANKAEGVVPHFIADPHASNAELIRATMLGTYDVRADDRRMRQALQGSDPATAFDELRKNYPLRRELAAVRIDNWNALESSTRAVLTALGCAHAGQ